MCGACAKMYTRVCGAAAATTSCFIRNSEGCGAARGASCGAGETHLLFLAIRSNLWRLVVTKYWWRRRRLRARGYVHEDTSVRAYRYRYRSGCFFSSSLPLSPYSVYATNARHYILHIYTNVLEYIIVFRLWFALRDGHRKDAIARAARTHARTQLHQ